MSLRDIDGDVRRLLELDRPAWNAYEVPGIRAFTPSQPQKNVLRTVCDSWGASLLTLARAVPEQVLVELHKWLRTKRETFEKALRNKQALHFDVLVLGILPINPIIVLASLTRGDLFVDPAREIAARFKLAAARQTLSVVRDPNSRASDGWASQVEMVYTSVYSLKDRYHVPDAEAEPFDVWYNQAEQKLAKGVHNVWPLLVQYGVRELLYFLYQALCELFNCGAKERACGMLMEWSPRRIVNRIKESIRAGQNCTIPLPNNTVPLEVLTSCDPHYFKALDLPHRVFGAHLGHPLDVQNRLNPAEQERAPGPAPRLSCCAAARYGINPEAWERQAALRWQGER